jgi:hypothetical protein
MDNSILFVIIHGFRNNQFMGKILFALSMALVTSCATGQLGSSGQRVMIVDSISASEMASYDYVDAIQSVGMASIEDCRNDLRNKAAAIGATILRVTSIEPAYCGLGGFQPSAPKNCFTAHADAFKPKIRQVI